VRTVSGREPLTVGETVYLTPNTKGATRECWSQPRAVVLRVHDPYVTVRLDVPAGGRPRATIPPTPLVVDPAAGAWIYEHVLTAKQREHHAALIEHCECQYGPCGHCGAGNHDRCAHRRPDHGPVRSCETYVISRAGHALTEVWPASGRTCTWRCPCPAPECAIPATDGPTVTTHLANAVRALPKRSPARRQTAAKRPADADSEALTLW
jgi:hypothetical protein